ncbi:MAG TPA: L-lactate permease, partial [Burkholderiales bacterium]|nr:L-lactate permease [Burkholderiales bacterium]
MAAALAAAPILTLLLLIVGLRWTAAAAGLVAAALTAAIALLAFDFGSAGALPALAGAAAEAAFSAAAILWIIFAALTIHEYQTRSGAIATFRVWLGSFGNNRPIAILLIAWFFALFLEGAAGFGTPVALAAPLLVGLGVPPVRALTAVLVGHAAGVSFGAVGTPIVPLADATGLDPHALAVGIVALHAALGWTLAASALRIADGK